MPNSRGMLLRWRVTLFSRLTAAGFLLLGVTVPSLAQESGASIETTVPTDEAMAGQAASEGDPASSLDSQTKTDIENAIRTWAAAWSKQDVPAYLARYASSFEPGNASLSLDGWKALRKTRLTTPRFIEVSISNLDIAIFDSGVHLATFVQNYKSDVFQERSLKSLEFIEDNQEWKIASERSIRLLE